MNRIKFAAMTTVVILTTTISQAQSLFSFASSSVGNEQTFGPQSGNISLDANLSTTGAAVTANASQLFTGVDDDFDPQTMSLTSNAYASAQYGILHASGQASLSNSFYSDNNDPYWDPTTNTLDPNGVPDFFLVAGTTRYSDVFTYTGVGAGFTVNFYYHIDGLKSGDGAYSNLVVTNNGNTEIFNTTSVNGVVNNTFVTQKYAVDGNFQINHSTTFTAGVSLHTDLYSNGSNLSGNSNFQNTITLTGMDVYDLNGDLYSGWGVTSGSGTIYPVPEPATMTILGLAALAAVRKRKRA